MTADRRPTLPIEPRGLSRVVAAAYVGVGVTKFDQMVADGLMPPPVQLGGRKVWDKRAVDLAFDALSDAVAPPEPPEEEERWKAA